MKCEIIRDLLPSYVDGLTSESKALPSGGRSPYLVS